MKKIKWVIGICLILILAFVYAHIAKANMIYDKSIDSSEYQNTGVVEGLIEQSFVCTEDSLDGISAKCQLNGDTTGISVKMELYDNETNALVAESEVDAEKIKNGKFNEYSFNTVENTKGKSYTVTFQNMNADVVSGRGVSFSFQNNTEDGTKLVINENETQGTLILKSITDRFDVETYVVLLLMIAYIAGFLVFLNKLFGK